MFLIEFKFTDWKKHIADLRGIIPQHLVRQKRLSVQTQKQAAYSVFWALAVVGHHICLSMRSASHKTLEMWCTCINLVARNTAYITRYTIVYTHVSSHSTSKKAFFQIRPIRHRSFRNSIHRKIHCIFLWNLQIIGVVATCNSPVFKVSEFYLRYISGHQMSGNPNLTWAPKSIGTDLPVNTGIVDCEPPWQTKMTNKGIVDFEEGQIEKKRTDNLTHAVAGKFE